MDASAWEHRSSIASSESGDNGSNSGDGIEAIVPSWSSTSGLPALPARKNEREKDNDEHILYNVGGNFQFYILIDCHTRNDDVCSRLPHV
jgi:hypothetical protein